MHLHPSCNLFTDYDLFHTGQQVLRYLCRQFCLSVEFFLAALLAAHLKLLHAASPSVLSGCGGESHCDAIVYPSQSDSHGCTRPKRFFILNITLRKQTTFVHISTIKLIKNRKEFIPLTANFVSTIIHLLQVPHSQLPSHSKCQIFVS